MKNRVFLLGTLVGVLCLFSACTKEYTCECDGTAANLGVETYTIEAKKESDAKSTCDGYADNTNGQVICTLK